MPKKKKAAGGAKTKGKVNKKAVEKSKKKTISDKTFGLKNKGKSKKVQDYAKRVASQVSDKLAKRFGVAGSGGDNQRLTFEERKKKREKEKTAYEMSKLNKKITKPTPKPKPILADVPSGFIEAVLVKFYGKYQRTKVDKVPGIVEKFKGKYELLEKGLKKQYGDKAPNLAKMYEKYKSENEAELALMSDAKNWEGLGGAEIVIEIEKQRRKLDTSKGTPVTLETFTAWKKKKRAEDEKVAAAKVREIAGKKGKKGGKSGLSGRDLYRLDASLFVDDEDAGDEQDYDFKSDAEEEEEEEKEEGKASAGAAVTQVEDESLFMDDDDIPDSDED